MICWHGRGSRQTDHPKPIIFFFVSILGLIVTMCVFWDFCFDNHQLINLSFSPSHSHLATRTHRQIIVEGVENAEKNEWKRGKFFFRLKGLRKCRALHTYTNAAGLIQTSTGQKTISGQFINILNMQNIEYQIWSKQQPKIE